MDILSIKAVVDFVQRSRIVSVSVKGGKSMAYYGAGTGSNFALSIVLFILLVIAGVGLWYLLRTLIYTNNL